VRGNDAERDGAYLELIAEETGAEVAEVFYSNITHKPSFSIFQQELSLDVAERLLARAKVDLPPADFVKDAAREVKRPSAEEKAAYRNLLYDAMLDIRKLCPSWGEPSNNPMTWRREYLRGRVAGALADWLHNLAQIAAHDFSWFDADWFWWDYDRLAKRFSEHFGPGNWMDYRARYERHLAEQDAT
jgi:hypothetical protein